MALPRLQDVTFSDADARKIQDKLKELYEAVRRVDEPTFELGDADPYRLQQLTQAAIISQVNADIDQTGKGQLLYYAGEETIEHLGYLWGRRGLRLEASSALTTIRYTLSTPLPTVVTIPAGSRITPNGTLMFATTRLLEIPIGDTYGDVEAQCETSGEIGNGFEPGTIRFIVDLPSFTPTAENITLSGGGADREGLEAYRERVWILPESFSVAGPDGAYEFWARTANPGIMDVKAWMPDLDLESFGEFLTPWGITDAGGFYEALYSYFRTSGTGPGNVNVAVLMRGGELPTQDVLKQVYEILDDRRVRPLTDFVHIKEAEAVDYEIDLSYWVWRSDMVYSLNHEAAVEEAVKEFNEWQMGGLGRDINPSQLKKRIQNTGIKRSVIREPHFEHLERWQIGHCTGVNLIFEGTEDD